jgi:2',3'-cyclic-nucleotide 2'-phosphodiesterase (5'-nucleotidase family)
MLATLTIFLIVATGLHGGEPATTLLTILHVNDYHGRVKPFIDKTINPQEQVGGAAYLAAMIRKVRAQNPGGTLLLAAGDMFQGSPVSNLFHGAPVMDVMNELKFDAMTLGNHEFDWGMGAFTRLRKEARFPFLAANIVNSRGSLLSGIRPYTILQKGHAKVAVIGLTIPETEYITKPDNVKGLIFLRPEAVLPRLIQEVRQQGASIVILLSHLGLDADRRVASAIPGIDVIVGGHSHTVIPKPLKTESGTIILQAGAYGVYLGLLELIVDKSTGRVAGFTETSGLRLVSAAPQDTPDRKIALIVKRYDDRVKQRLAAVVGETSVDLTAKSGSESNLGDLVADAMRAATGGQIAFQNSGGIRANIPAGTITMEGLYTVLPFDNVLVSMNLTGRQVKEALEQGGTMEFGGLQISGMTITYDLKRAAGERLVKAEVGGEPLDPGKTYTVVTNDFLAAGGDKVAVLKEGKNVAYGDTLSDALVQYLKKQSPVSPKIEGRILFAE